MQELRSRGVSKVLALECVGQFFEDNSEEDQFEKACKKLEKQGKKGEKLVNALIRLGFSSKLIGKRYKKFED
jgi:SOS response regulatory protein OraA/RecX